MEETHDKYSKEEALRRFEQALRGARIAGHKSMKEIAPKQPKPQRKRKQLKRR